MVASGGSGWEVVGRFDVGFIKMFWVGDGESDWIVGRASGALVATGLVQVAFVHWYGLRRVLADECGGEVRPSSEVAGIDCFYPCGECGRKTAGMVVGNSFCDGRIGAESTVNVKWDVIGLLRKIDVPKFCCGGSVSDNGGVAIVVDFHRFVVKMCGASGIAELSYREK